ncbi:MAG: antibiotic biosynthesis monooxygenase [Caldilineaceae bacterium]|nr:antibiotic biosynthesis monooxygenase [Caldilineaceae bacterium]
MAFVAMFQGTAAPEHLSTVKESVAILERESRDQPGTIRYEFYQSADDPTVFLLFAIWETEADWRAHVASEAHQKHVASLPAGAWKLRPVKSEWQALTN